MEPVFERAYRNAVQSGLLPGAVLLAASADGAFQYERCFGSRSLASGRERPIEKTDIFAIGSCGKLMTIVAVLQCVERGFLDLDIDVRAIIPEIYTHGIITGWDEQKNEAILSPITGKMTIRHLITGSSGHSYKSLNPLLKRWEPDRDRVRGGGETVEEKHTLPLLFEPGTGWAYGGGWDWAGKMVERVTDLSLEDYMRENLWSPLGLKDCTFWPLDRSDYDHRRVDMSLLDTFSKKAKPGTDEPLVITTDCRGGVGLYASATDFLNFQLAILRRDERLLQKASFETLFQPQLSPASTQALKRMYETNPVAQAWFGANLPKGVAKNMAFGGLLCDEDVPGAMHRGTIQWVGKPCLIWFIDPHTKVCGIAWSQVLPALAPPIHALHAGFQYGIYEVYEAHSRAKSRTSTL